MYARFYRVVFRGEAERVKAYGLKNFVAFHFLIAGKTVGQTVIVPMPYVQFCCGWIGKHFQTIIFFIRIFWVKIVNFFFFPIFLPFLFNPVVVHKASVNIR